MNYRETLYKNALTVVEMIYRESQYNEDVDIYRAYDVMNSVNDSQIQSKEWLIEKLVPFIDTQKVFNICILGSWYGLISMLLREQVGEDIHIHNVDSDRYTEKFSKLLLEGTPTQKTHYVIEQAEEWIFDNLRKCDIIINTSCEHMEQDDLNLIVATKKPNDIVCFQGNDYHSVQSHNNTHTTLDEFVDSFNLTRVYYKGTLKHPDYNRYMVIGI